MRQNLALLIVEPFVTLLLVWTNGFHGLIESTVRLNTSGPFSSLVVNYGLWYWVNVAAFKALDGLCPQPQDHLARFT